jgi:hypothetical protein
VPSHWTARLEVGVAAADGPDDLAAGGDGQAEARRAQPLLQAAQQRTVGADRLPDSGAASDSRQSGFARAVLDALPEADVAAASAATIAIADMRFVRWFMRRPFIDT